MTDQLISFETAKLAKEKRFTNPKDMMCWIESRNPNYNKANCLRSSVPYITEGCDTILQPTQSLLQKWLRETYGLSVEVNFNICLVEQMNGWYWRIVFTKHYIKSFTNLDIVNNTCCYIGSKANPKDLFNPYSEYEEALEQGLFKALKLLS
jgi:hypothetical protein